MVYHHKLVIDTGEIITINSQLKRKLQEEVKGKISGKKVMTDNLNTVQYSEVKQAENTEG